MSAGETLVAAWRLLELCVAGEVPEANALSQHLHRRSPRAVLQRPQQSTTPLTVESQCTITLTLNAHWSIAVPLQGFQNPGFHVMLPSAPLCEAS